MTTEKNMQIWSQICETPQESTKQCKKGNWSFSDINPQYRLQRLTELFGPAGLGWGYDIVERWRDNWGAAADSCYVMLRLWYVLDGKRYDTPPQIGGTVVDYAPDECWKMSITDALGKCCATLGLAADVYLGTFDTKYREKGETTEKYQPKTARSYVRKPQVANDNAGEAILNDPQTPF